MLAVWDSLTNDTLHQFRYFTGLIGERLDTPATCWALPLSSQYGFCFSFAIVEVVWPFQDRLIQLPPDKPELSREKIVKIEGSYVFMWKIRICKLLTLMLHTSSFFYINLVYKRLNSKITKTLRIHGTGTASYKELFILILEIVSVSFVPRYLQGTWVTSNHWKEFESLCFEYPRGSRQWTWGLLWHL